MIAKKRFIQLMSAILCYCSVCFSQADSIAKMYPIQIGNQWQYKTDFWKSYWEAGMMMPTTYHTVTITGDTLLGNGKKYVIFQCSGDMTILYPRFQRVDTLTREVFGFDTTSGGREFPMDTLNGTIHSAYYGSRLLAEHTSWFYSIDTQNVFGNRVVCKTVLTGIEMFTPSLRYTLTNGFGVASGQYSLPGFDYVPGDTHYDTLIYAKIDNREFGTLVSVKPIDNSVYSFELYQNYPNPFNPTTTISFTINQKAIISLEVYDLLGRRVSSLADGYRSPGRYRAQFDAKGLNSGVYFYRLSAAGYTAVRKMLLVR